MIEVEIKNVAVSGTTESSDIMFIINQNSNPEIEIDLQSDVEKQFGDHVRQLIKDTVQKLGVTQVKIKAIDKGALDCTIKARLITAILRAADETNIDWKVIDSWNA